MINKGKFSIYVERKDFGRSCAISVAQEFDGNKIGVMKPIEFEVMDRDVAFNRDPFLYMPDNFGQQLIDELYRAGYRPSQSGAAGEIHAIRYHLEDMRSLVKGMKKND